MNFSIEAYLDLTCSLRSFFAEERNLFQLNGLAEAEQIIIKRAKPEQ